MRGLVERLACVKDGRATNVHLTATGRDALVAAAPGHVAQVRASLIDAVTPEHCPRRHLRRVLDRIDPDRTLRMTAPVAGAL